jgi:hypothetical protein
VEEFAQLLSEYQVTTVIGDRYAGEWPRERFAEHGITYRTADLTRSEYYLTLLPLLTSGQVELLDVPRLHGQLVSLERRTGRSGKDAVDAPPRQHEDVANAAAGAIVMAHELSRCDIAAAPGAVDQASPWTAIGGDSSPGWASRF